MANNHGDNQSADTTSSDPISAISSNQQKESVASHPERKFPVATHNGHHNKTPKEDFERVETSSSWQNQELSPLELIDWISSGRSWVACHLTGGKRNEDNAGISDLIVLDIDGDIRLEDFWAIHSVARHCLFTITSCSHTPEEHRFRAVFCCERHDDVRLHRAIYHQLLAALGLKLKDNCGEKPERHWFGNDKAEIQFGQGEPLSWELIENARDALSAAAQARAERAALASSGDQATDNQRAAWVLEHLLRPSVDGEFQAYWSPLLNAAAATGDDAVRDAFMVWHHKGHHSRTQNRVAKRLDKAGTRLTPGEGAGRILQFAKQQQGEQWWRRLPESLWYGGGPAVTPPISLLRARSAGDIAADGDTTATQPLAPEPPQAGGSPSLFRSGATGAAIPDRVPSALELQRLASAAASPATPEPLTLEAKLRRLYMLRAHGILQLGDDLQQAPSGTRGFLDRELLGDVLAHAGYCNQPSEVERDLLKLLRNEHGLEDNSNEQVQGCQLLGVDLPRPQWLIPGYLLVGGEHVLYAKAGVGKTTIALHMARAVTGDPGIDSFLDSGPLNNHHLWQASQVIFIGTDMYHNAREMTSAYLIDFGLAGLDFLKQIDWWFEQKKPKTPGWMLCLKDLTKLYNTLEGAKAAGAPVAAVFIDSMKAVCPDHLLVGQQGFKDYIKLVREICGEFDAALIWIHHSSADGSRAQGISRITEGSDANFHMKRDDKTKQITLEVEKIRGGGNKGRARTLYIDPFKTEPQLLRSLDDISEENSIEDHKEQIVLEVLSEHFKQHRLLNTTSSPAFIEKSYLGMKIGEIEKALSKRFHGKVFGLGRRNLSRILHRLSEKRMIIGKGNYRLPPRCQPNLPDQGNLLDSDISEDIDLPGW
jgi:hypothetical protein